MSHHVLPAHLELLFSRPEIEARLQALAAEITGWSNEARAVTGQPLLAICVLRGGVFFFSDLLLRLGCSVEPGFCRASSYGRNQNEQPADALNLDLGGLEVAGRAVVVVDNICDSGRTFAVCQRAFESAGAASCRSVALVHRLRTDSSHTPTAAGFTYPGTEWLAGYGLRDRGEWMNAPEVYRVLEYPRSAC